MQSSRLNGTRPLSTRLSSTRSADSRLARTDSQPRIIVVAAAIALCAAVCFARLFAWHTVDRARIMEAGNFGSVSTAAERPNRGTITDRTGSVVLAETVMRHNIVAQPAQMSSEEHTAASAAISTALSLGEIEGGRIHDALASGRSWVTLLTGLDDAQSAAVASALDAASVRFVTLVEVRMRNYKQVGGAAGTTLASHLLGFVNADGKGQYGLEAYYEQELAGDARVTRTERGSDGVDRVIELAGGHPGSELRLCLDATLQTLVEQEVAAAGVADRAESVSVMVMDPFTGNLLSSASWPAYDANDFASTAARDPSRFIDPAISSVYEPGSVMKTLTSVAALEAGGVTTESTFQDETALILDNGLNKVQNANHRSMGTMTLRQALSWSRNVVFSKIALGLGSTTDASARAIYSTWLKFGIGTKTGIDLAGENYGLVNDPTRPLYPWREIDVANASFGQGLSTTLAQLAVAYSAVINGGVLVSPRVVDSIDGVRLPITVRGTATSPKVSAQVVDMLGTVTKAVPLYARLTNMPAYSYGGKTGTAQIWLKDARNEKGGKGAWDPSHYNFTFVGWIGRTSPEYVIAVSIRRGTPVVNLQGNILNNVESFELFRRVAEDLISVMGIPPAATTGGLTSPARLDAPEPSAPVASGSGGDLLPARREEPLG